jgi:hypothetical protein
VLKLNFNAASVNESGLSTVSLSLVPLEKPNFLIELSFTGVRDLHIGKASADGIDCFLFEVSDMSQSQWEGVNWLVGDFKGEAFGFYAKTAEVISISKLE